MKQAYETHPQLWKAYYKALGEAEMCLREVDEAKAAVESVRTIEARELAKQKVAAAKTAVDAWRQTADELYHGMGIA